MITMSANGNKLYKCNNWLAAYRTPLPLGAWRRIISDRGDRSIERTYYEASRHRPEQEVVR